MGFSALLKKLKGFKAEPEAPVQPEPVIEPPKVEKAEPPPKVAVVKRPEPAPVKPISPLALSGGSKSQSDWMLLQIGKTGRAFIAIAERKSFIAKPGTFSDAFVRHDMTAALLGYQLMMTAYHFHQDPPSLEAMRIVRTAMVGMLHRAVDITVEQTGKRDERKQMLTVAEEQFKLTEKEILNACARLRENASQPFSGFYSGLTPAFGPLDTEEAMHQRFGAALQELYGKIESAMASRNHLITG